MILNKIIKLKNNKYKIVFDNEYIITYDNVILGNDLLYKKSINISLYKKLVYETAYYDIYNRVVKYILKKLRSEKEIRIYLNKFDLSEVDRNKIITKLKEINLINDKSFCKAYINDKLYLSKDGLNKIKKDLLDNDIPIDVIEETLNNVDKKDINDRLEKLVLKKIKSNKKYSNNYLKKKILNEMIYLGYDKESIINILDKNMVDDHNLLNDEFNKLYTKLSKKYEGNNLSIKLKQKLILKGFNIDDINLIINKKNTED